MTGITLNVAILGASNKPDRYSHKALVFLLEQGHRPYLVHPLLTEIEGFPVYSSLRLIPYPIDTVTVYLSAKNQQAIAEDILQSSCRRIIFNPGAENPELEQQLKKQGKNVLQACTLVMLKTGQF